jgi:hypothetical protein
MDEELKAFDAAEQAAGSKLADAWQTFFQNKGVEAIDRGAEIEQMARIAEVQHAHEDEIMRMQNVVGVAASLKVVKGKPTNKYSLTIFVEKKLPLAKVAKASRVAEEIDGVVTDVVEVGRPEALLFNTRVRPALPGFSVGHHNITAGTYGCMVQDVRTGDYLMLSNNHVFAATNRGQIGDLILQPGPFDGGLFPSDGIATLDRFEPIVFGASGYNLVDAAVARPTFNRNVTSSIIGVRMPSGINQAFIGNLVIKAGRTTQVTVGVVTAVNATVAVGYGSAGVAQYRHQIVTTAMAAGGDSGSLLMNAGLQAVGLLYAGSAIITIHNHIADVEAALGIRPLTAPR